MYTAKKPPKPTAPTSRVSQTCGSRSADSSWRGLAPSWASTRGTSSSIATRVSTPITTTVAYVLRQPSHCPSSVVSGTPTTLATVRPIIVIATARARRCRGTSEEASTAPMPK